eukprot:Em0207g3a
MLVEVIFSSKASPLPWNIVSNQLGHGDKRHKAPSPPSSSLAASTVPSSCLSARLAAETGLSPPLWIMSKSQWDVVSAIPHRQPKEVQRPGFGEKTSHVERQQKQTFDAELLPFAVVRHTGFTLSAPLIEGDSTTGNLATMKKRGLCSSSSV